MRIIPFFKICGCGNDFIIIDNRKGIVTDEGLSDFIKSICRRRMSVGADGLILIEDSEIADFKWQFYNSDGSPAEMCGNGARCAARFAYINDIAGSKLIFETQVGLIEAVVSGHRVNIKITDPSPLETDLVLALETRSTSYSRINTGVPHVVKFVENYDYLDVVELGRKIRYHKEFEPEGTNVNFTSIISEGVISNRTYERGVEDETLACGTGSVAAALVTARVMGMESPITVHTLSGEYLTVYFKEKDEKFFDIYLEGDARIIYKGELWEEAWKKERV